MHLRYYYGIIIALFAPAFNRIENLSSFFYIMPQFTGEKNELWQTGGTRMR